MDKKINVCLLNDAFPPAIDGVANVVVNYAKELSNMDSKVIVATPEYPSSNDSEYNFDVYRYPSINTIEKIGYVTGIPFDVPYLSKFAEKDIDILHTHCPMTSNYLARILRDTLKKPIVLTYHTKYDIDIKRTIKEKPLQKAAIDAVVSNISACDEVWAVSKGAAENLKSLGYKGEVIVMENGVDMPKGISSQEEIEAIKKEYGLKDNVPIYLFVGRMMWYKGIKIILDALKMLKDDNKDFQMLFVGSGIEYEEIKNYSSSLKLDDKVIFAGAVSNRAKLKQVFSACDIFLFPSTFDTNGLVVREAASSALGSILIKGSCAAEGVTDLKNAILIDENAQSLKEALEKYDVKTFKEIGKNAMSDLYISWEDATKKAYERYKYLLENYKYEEKKYELGDNFFALLSEASKVFSETKDVKNDIEEMIEEEKEKLNKKRENIRNTIKEKVDSDIDEIKNIAKEIKNKL